METTNRPILSLKTPRQTTQVTGNILKSENGSRPKQGSPRPKQEKKIKSPQPPKQPKIPYALQMNGHDQHIQEFIDNKIPVTITLMSGYEYTGILAYGDRYAMVMKTDDTMITFFKHAIESYYPILSK
jgi:RNA chaperone Hfq